MCQAGGFVASVAAPLWRSAAGSPGAPRPGDDGRTQLSPHPLVASSTDFLFERVARTASLYVFMADQASAVLVANGLSLRTRGAGAPTGSPLQPLDS